MFLLCSSPCGRFLNVVRPRLALAGKELCCVAPCAECSEADPTTLTARAAFGAFDPAFSGTKTPPPLAASNCARGYGKMIASVMAALAEFEHDLLRERIKSGIAAAKARGKKLGRQPGQRPSDRKAATVIEMAKGGLSYRLIGREIGLSKNTVATIIQRARRADGTRHSTG